MPAESGAAMNRAERRAVGVLSIVYATRLLGLFMLLPVLALYADGLAGATPLLVGVSVGAYGITQALLQVPFGAASDRFGRKPLLYFGLSLLMLGGVVAALSDHIALVILGRALQGAGAISAVLTALLADLTREAVRTRALALVGASIGLTFLVALIAGPVLAYWLGVDGLFLVTAGLAFAALLLVAFAVPDSGPTATPGRGGWKLALRNPVLLELDLGIFSLHFLLAAVFVALPFALRDGAGIATEQHWQFYLAVLLVSLLGTVALIRAVERSSAPRRLTLFAVALLVAAQVALALLPFARATLAGSMVVFFAAFNFLEARLPAEVSAASQGSYRGAALGVYASAQFLGIFAGGSLAGVLMATFSPREVFLLGALTASIWLLVRGGAFRVLRTS